MLQLKEVLLPHFTTDLFGKEGDTVVVQKFTHFSKDRVERLQSLLICKVH